jgi:hypothetical protein
MLLAKDDLLKELVGTVEGVDIATFDSGHIHGGFPAMVMRERDEFGQQYAQTAVGATVLRNVDVLVRPRRVLLRLNLVWGLHILVRLFLLRYKASERDLRREKRRVGAEESEFVWWSHVHSLKYAVLSHGSKIDGKLGSKAHSFAYEEIYYRAASCHSKLV